MEGERARENRCIEGEGEPLVHVTWCSRKEMNHAPTPSQPCSGMLRNNAHAHLKLCGCSKKRLPLLPPPSLYRQVKMKMNSEETFCSQPNQSQNIIRKKHHLQGGYECIFVKAPPDHLQTECSVCAYS